MRSRHRAVKRCEADRTGVVALVIRIPQVVDERHDRDFVKPSLRAEAAGLGIETESAVRAGRARIAENRIVEGHCSQCGRPALAKREAGIKALAERMMSAQRIGTREVVFEVMSPFMQNDVIVKFIGIVVGVPAQKQRIDVAIVKRRAQRADINVATFGRRVFDTPECIQRGESRSRVSCQHKLDGRVNRVEDRKWRCSSSPCVTVSTPARGCRQIFGDIGTAGIEIRPVEHVQRTADQCRRIGLVGIDHIVPYLDVPGR